MKRYTWLLILVCGVIGAFLLFLSKENGIQRLSGMILVAIALFFSIKSDKGAFFKVPKKEKENPEKEKKTFVKKGGILYTIQRFMAIALIGLILVIIIGILVVTKTM